MAYSIPQTMKSARATRSGPLEQTLHVSNDMPLPATATSLPANHVLVKVAYTSLNPMDFKVAENPLLSKLVFKGIPCLDFSGTVVKSSSADFREGDQVFGQTQPMNFGACAEYLVVSDALCVTVPEGLEIQDAATIGIAGLTAYQTVVPFVKTGDRVLVNGGSGGVGTYAIQFAKAIGCSVTVVCSGGNAELCRAIGADDVIDYWTQDVVETLTTKGEKYHLIVDYIFSDARIYWASQNYLNADGRFVTVTGGLSFTFVRDLFSIMLWPTMLGGGKRKFQMVGRKVNRDEYEQIAKWIVDGSVKPVIEKTYDLEDVRSAFERLKSGRTRGKLVVKIT